MVKIRLARVGKKKQPTYRLVVSDSQKDLYGKYLEILGNYNPFSKVCDVKKDRILFWIKQGAQCSPTAHNLLVDQNVITAKKVKASKAGKKKAADVPAEASAQAGAPAAPAAATAEAAPVEVPAETPVVKETKTEPAAETPAKTEEPAA